MHGPINLKSPNNISKWQMGFNSAFKGLKCLDVIVFTFIRFSLANTGSSVVAMGLVSTSFHTIDIYIYILNLSLELDFLELERSSSQ
jgi:hypothetical protein